MPAPYHRPLPNVTSSRRPSLLVPPKTAAPALPSPSVSFICPWSEPNCLEAHLHRLSSLEARDDCFLF